MSVDNSRADEALPDSLDEAHQTITALRERLRTAEHEIHRLQTSDPLTGAGNRRAWDDAVAAELLRIKRYGGDLSIVVVGLDNLFEITEQYGHGVGDKVLRKFVEMIADSTRQTDSAFRLGGDKFSILMPQTRLAAADMIANRILGMVSDTSSTLTPKPLQASFGVAEFREGEGGLALMGRADDALYRARKNGGNSVVAS